MGTISIVQLTTADSVSGGDLFPFYSQANGDVRKVSVTTLANYFSSVLLANVALAAPQPVSEGLDSVLYFDASNGTTTRVLLQTLAVYFSAQAAAAQAQATQRAAPSATGWNVTVAPPVAGQNMRVIITPTAGYAAGSLTMPPVAGAVHGQTVTVNITQQVAAFSVNANGATAVTNAPSSIGAGDFFTFQYDSLTSTWYRVG